MRVFKPTYSKSLPDEAKVFNRKDGKYAKFRNGRGRLVEAKLTKSGDRILVETGKWHIEFEDNRAIKRRMKGFTDHSATQRLADRVQEVVNCKANNTPLGGDLQRFIEQAPGAIREQLQEFRLINLAESAIGRPLEVLLAEFEYSLRAQELSDKYVYETITMARTMFGDCGFTYWADISAAKVEAYLKDLREGVRGLSYRRSNAYLKAGKHFCNWLIKRSYVHSSPLQTLKELAPKLDPRRQRRAITVSEVKRLLYATVNSEESHGMAGYERYLLYRFAIETGLRANEIRKLRKADFDFEHCTVTVEAMNAKGKRKDVQPLSSGLAGEIQDFLGNKLSDAKVFGGCYTSLTDKTAPMLRGDLKAAGIPYKDETGKVFDFHALRGQCASLLAASGVHPKTAQVIMRHRDINMTMSTYTHVLRGQESAAVESLPDLSLPGCQSEEMRKTGTDDWDATSESLFRSCFSGGSIRTDMDGNDTMTPCGASETAVVGEENSLGRTSNPKVAGSSPAGRVVPS
jgi:integrase